MKRIISSISFLTFGLSATASALVAAPTINVSVEPLALLVREICAAQCEVFVLVPRGTSEHSWRPGPKDIIRAKQALGSIAVGLEFDDSWFKKLGVTPTSILKLGSQLSPMGWWSDDMSGLQGANALKKEKSHKHHSHDEAGHSGESHAHAGSLDPHVWTDAGRMATAAELIGKHLASLIKGQEQAFMDRGKAVSDRLTKLQLEIDTRRKTWRTRPVVMFHDTAGYFARRFNLPVLSVAAGATGHELSAKLIARVSRKFKDASVAAVMVEKNDGAAKNLAKELKTQVKIVDFAANKSYKNWDEWYQHLATSWESALR
jgi:zinc transport system substrate-binding protein